MSPAEIQQDRRRRRRFSVFVAIVSLISAASLYVGIMGLIENSSTDRDVARITQRIIKVERPSRRELAERVRIGLRECERRPKCRRDVRHRARRLGQRPPTSPRTPGAPNSPGRGGHPSSQPGSPPLPSPSPSPSPAPGAPSPIPGLPPLPLPPLPDLGLPALPALP